LAGAGGSAGGPLAGRCALSATGRTWATQSCQVEHITDVHTLYLVFAGAANLNWMEFH
jgi:hypothetical protein